MHSPTEGPYFPRVTDVRGTRDSDRLVLLPHLVRTSLRAILMFEAVYLSPSPGPP